MTARRILVSAGALLAAGLWCVALFASRDAWLFHMSDAVDEGGLGIAWESALDLYRTFAWLDCATPLLGGVLCIILGPRIVLALAGLPVAVGTLGIAVGSADTMLAAMTLVAVGKGMFWPALMATVAPLLGYPLENARTALFLGFYAAINAGMLTGNVVSGAMFALADEASAGVWFAVALMGLVIPLTVAVAWGARPPALPDGPRRVRPQGAVVGAAIVMALYMPHAGAFMLGSGAHTAAIEATFSAAVATSVHDLNPLIVIVVAILTAPLFLTLSGRRPLPAAIPMGAALTLYGLCVLPMAFPGVVGGALGTVGLASFMGCAALEPLVGGIICARLVGDLPPRAGAMVVGVWSAIQSVLFELLRGGADQPLRSGEVGAAAALCVVAGLVMVAMARSLQRTYFTPDEEWSLAPPEPQDRSRASELG